MGRPPFCVGAVYAAGCGHPALRNYKSCGINPVRYKECGAPKRLSPQGSTDCRSQCAHWLRNDRVFAWGAVDFLVVRRGGALPLPHG